MARRKNRFILPSSDGSLSQQKLMGLQKFWFRKLLRDKLMCYGINSVLLDI